MDSVSDKTTSSSDANTPAEAPAEETSFFLTPKTLRKRFVMRARTSWCGVPVPAQSVASSVRRRSFFFPFPRCHFSFDHSHSPHLTRVIESGFQETTTREIGFPYSAETFIRFKRWLASKSSSSSSSTSTQASHSDQSDDATSNSSNSGCNTPRHKQLASDSGNRSPEDSSGGGSSAASSAGSNASSSSSSSVGLTKLKELLDCADQYLEADLLAKVGEQILTRPLTQLGDFALTYSLAFSLEQKMPGRARYAKEQCLDLVVRELMSGMPYLTCPRCSHQTEHYGYPVAAKVPACRCDTCPCIRQLYDAKVAPQAPLSCSCKAQLLARICLQRQHSHGLPVHSPALAAALCELADMGDVEPLAALASITEALVPFFDPRFVAALSEPQMLYLLSNTVTAYRHVGLEHVETLRAKGFEQAAARAQAIIDKR